GRARRWSATEFQNIKPGIIVGRINQTLRIYEYVRRLNHARAVWPRVRECLRLRRHQRADFFRRECVGYVEHTDASILMGREDHLRTDEGAGPVLVEIVRPEMAALRLVVGFGRCRES